MRSTAKPFVVGSLLLGSLLLSTSSRAQPLEGTTAVTLENVVGALWHKTDYPDLDGYEARSMRYIGVSSGMMQYGAPALPRVGVHHFFGAFSVGGALHYSDNDDFGTHTVLAPRLGFSFPWSESSALWLRGGVTWTKWGMEDIEISGLLVGGEVLAVMMPVDNVGIMLGGIYEHGVSGSTEIDVFDHEEDTRLYAYGFTTGMAFLF